METVNMTTNHAHGRYVIYSWPKDKIYLRRPDLVIVALTGGGPYKFEAQEGLRAMASWRPQVKEWQWAPGADSPWLTASKTAGISILGHKELNSANNP